jgi:hypothetical protein
VFGLQQLQRVLFVERDGAGLVKVSVKGFRDIEQDCHNRNSELAAMMAGIIPIALLAKPAMAVNMWSASIEILNVSSCGKAALLKALWKMNDASEGP